MILVLPEWLTADDDARARELYLEALGEWDRARMERRAKKRGALVVRRDSDDDVRRLLWDVDGVPTRRQYRVARGDLWRTEVGRLVAVDRVTGRAGEDDCVVHVRDLLNPESGVGGVAFHVLGTWEPVTPARAEWLDGSEVGHVACLWAAAPGTGRTLYLVTRVDEGRAYAAVLTSNVRELRPDEVR